MLQNFGSMRLLYCLLIFSFMFSACKKEKLSTPSEREENLDSIQDVTPDYSLNHQIIDSEKFVAKDFEARIPLGFTAEASYGNAINFDEFNSYFFTTPDSLAKFYAYSGPSHARPNDIIFPNEKIATEEFKKGDTLILQWKLPPNLQTEYHRMLSEKTFGEQKIITGFYFKDSISYHQYLPEFQSFENSLKTKSSE